jgi:hypothetical protein
MIKFDRKATKLYKCTSCTIPARDIVWITSVVAVPKPLRCAAIVFAGKPHFCNATNCGAHAEMVAPTWDEFQWMTTEAHAAQSELVHKVLLTP